MLWGQSTAGGYIRADDYFESITTGSFYVQFCWIVCFYVVRSSKKTSSKIGKCCQSSQHQGHNAPTHPPALASWLALCSALMQSFLVDWAQTLFYFQVIHLTSRSSYHMSCFLGLFMFRGHSSSVTHIIYGPTQERKKSREGLEKMQVNGPEE